MPKLMTTALDRAAAAIAEATAGITESDAPESVDIRVRTQTPDEPYAHSTFVGSFTSDDARTIAGRLAVTLGGRVETNPAGLAIQITWGEQGHYLSMGELAKRARLQEQTIRQYRTRGTLPEPDITVGRTPGWLPATADAWIASLPGQGARTDLSRLDVNDFEVIEIVEDNAIGAIAVQHQGEFVQFTGTTTELIPALGAAREYIATRLGTPVKLSPAVSNNSGRRWIASLKN